MVGIVLHTMLIHMMGTRIRSDQVDSGSPLHGFSVNNVFLFRGSCMKISNRLLRALPALCKICSSKTRSLFWGHHRKKSLFFSVLSAPVSLPPRMICWNTCLKSLSFLLMCFFPFSVGQYNFDFPETLISRNPLSRRS